MDQMLQQFEAPVRDGDGNSYVVCLYGRSRPADSWQGWLVFERISDRRRFSTPVETTQPNDEAVVYWGTGLGATYFDGALQRALNPAGTATAVPMELLAEFSVDSAEGRESLPAIERDVLVVRPASHAARVVAGALRPFSVRRRPPNRLPRGIS